LNATLIIDPLNFASHAQPIMLPKKGKSSMAIVWHAAVHENRTCDILCPRIFA
jgi:hypothetical protein